MESNRASIHPVKQVGAVPQDGGCRDPFAMVGTVFAGRFRVEQRIAEGGFAVVYKAVQVVLERRVALKVLKTAKIHNHAGRAEFEDKFASEAKTIARIRHPHIVDVYDFSISTLPGGEVAPWMALEWLDGETLASRLKQRRNTGHKGLPPEEAVDFLRPALVALAYAHSQGIVHRDIKPANVMVMDSPQGASLRVLDFGIAKMMVDDLGPNTGNTRTESVPSFSPAYAAPEQVAFSRTGPWTDVHALGLMLSEVMTDQSPFWDPDPETHLFERVMATRRPTPAARGRDVGIFEPIIARALALSPRDRWKNAGELLAALDQARVDSHRGLLVTPTLPVPGAAGPQGSRSRWTSLRLSVSRRQALSALALGMLLAAVGVLRGVRPGSTSARSSASPVPSLLPSTSAASAGSSLSAQVRGVVTSLPQSPTISAAPLMSAIAAAHVDAPVGRSEEPPGQVPPAKVIHGKVKKTLIPLLSSRGGRVRDRDAISPLVTDGRELFADTK